jgi:cephalosporin hydroxylase/glycosyltransferase involved in cell wall biosynthesis
MSSQSHEQQPSHAPEGVVDGLNGPTLRGWAWIPDEEASALHVEVRDGDKLLGQAAATDFRADLAAAGKRGGHCAFAIELDPLPASGTLLNVTATLEGVNHPLAGSPYAVPAPSSTSVPAEWPTDVLPLPIHTPQLHGSLDQVGPTRMHGWVRRLDGNRKLPTLALCENGLELVRFEANQWRPDIAELHQGDGCCGFELPLPANLCDGRAHTLELCLANADATPLVAPFRVRTAHAAWATQQPAPLARTPVADPLTLSIIVNFYNMPREAARTLVSLGRDYQQGIADLDYEVLCIDNGSQPPLDPEWIAGFGPQFRLIRPEHPQGSPCAALNDAARQARGRYLAVMIDGAHLLTPGTFREALAAWRESPEAVIALRRWFVGGDQRWLALAGYTREQENQLFEHIRWPTNGYDLFRISTPVEEVPEPWFDGVSESNCLLLPTALFDRIGGFDEAFAVPGGGFANLDLWRRASDAADGPLVALVGEASFHQFHDGTTTNVDDAKKDARVRAYAHAYRSLRGMDFSGVHRSRLSFRGHMPSEFATGVRQRTLFPRLPGVTNQVRPGQLALHFDNGAQTYLQSVYAECALQRAVTWLGQPVGVAPADLIAIQQILHQLRPDAVIAAGVEAGLADFIRDILAADGNEARLLYVDPSATAAASSRTTVLHGAPDASHALATAHHWAGSAENMLVLYAPDAQTGLTLPSLHAWGELVSHRSWLICVGTVFGQPWLGYANQCHLQTIRDFTAGKSPFVIDHSWNGQLLSTNPSGYLRKVSGVRTAADYDATLDDIPIAPFYFSEHAP